MPNNHPQASGRRACCTAVYSHAVPDISGCDGPQADAGTTSRGELQQRAIIAEECGPQLLCALRIDLAPGVDVVQQQQHQVQRRVHAHLGPQ